MRRSIGQPLADNALKRALGPRNVIASESDAIAVPEIELGKVAVQVLFLAMPIDALHAALKHRIMALDGVGVNRAGDVFAFGVVTDSWLANSSPSFL